MGKMTDLGNFITSIENILDKYADDKTEALEKGLDEAQNYMIQTLKDGSPSNTGDYRNHWKPGESGKGYRRVINDKTVAWKGKQQSLAKILEYSTKHSKPHVEEIKRKDRPKIMRILKESIQKTNN